MRKFKYRNKTVKFVCAFLDLSSEQTWAVATKMGRTGALKVVVVYVTKYLFFVPLLLVNVLLESRHLALQLRHLQKQCITHRTTGAKKLRKETKFRES